MSKDRTNSITQTYVSKRYSTATNALLMMMMTATSNISDTDLLPLKIPLETTAETNHKFLMFLSNWIILHTQTHTYTRQTKVIARRYKNDVQWIICKHRTENTIAKNILLFLFHSFLTVALSLLRCWWFDVSNDISLEIRHLRQRLASLRDCTLCV